MQAEVTFIGGDVADFDDTTEVKLTAYGVEVFQRENDGRSAVLLSRGRASRR